MKVLVVDDNEDHLMLARVILEDDGYTVFTSNQVSMALRILDRESIDLIILDIMLPYRDGFDAIRSIRSDPANKDLPIIAVTVCAGQGEEERILGAGFDDYMSKPYDEASLLAKVREALAKRPVKGRGSKQRARRR